MTQVRVLRATGRTGRGVVEGFAAAGLGPVLVGRDAGRLAALAEERGYATIGPFTSTARASVDACLAVGSDHAAITCTRTERAT